jgi:adenylate cyclase
VLTVDFNLNQLSEFVAALKLSSRGQVFLFTPDGKLVAHPTVRAVEKKGGGTAGELTTVAKSGDPVAETLLATIGNAVDDARELTLTVGGERWMARVRPFSIDDNAQAARWLVAAVAPEADFLGGVRKTTVTALLISTVALCGALILAVLLANRVSRPLLRLAEEMNRVGSFELDLAPQPKTMFVEIARMGEALDKMKRGLHSFASYVPRDLVRTLVASGREAKLGGETATLTVFFSDLAGFTTLSETMKPDELVAQLGGYLDEMTRTIERGGGTVDKFIGDGIMAFWGAPLPDENHAARALVAALRCQERLEAMRARADGAWMRGVETRIGLATGAVVVGNIGTPERMNYTVMGDTVNLAARLESLSKLYGTLLLAEESSVRAAGDAVVTRPIDVVAVKGKKRGVRVFELLAVKGEASERTLAMAAASGAGLEAYLARDFVAAERHYREVLAVAPDDRVAKLFIERAQALAAEPPPPEWDGTYVAKEK